MCFPPLSSFPLVKAAGMSTEKMLQEVTGFEDVTDFLVALKSMPVGSVVDYLDDAFGKHVLTAAIARALAEDGGTQVEGKFYRKKQDTGSAAPPAAKAEKEKGRVPGGGVTVVVHEKKRGGTRLKATAAGLDSLHRALRAGRHQCGCNAQRHALLHNCLSCGKVICAQEGAGTCLFCESDPHVGLWHAATSLEATRRKERLLDFDRSAAKRTTVIDDQADYFSFAAADAWLSTEEKAAAANAQQEREDDARERQRNFCVTLDFAGQRVVREERGESAATENDTHNGEHKGRNAQLHTPGGVPGAEGGAVCAHALGVEGRADAPILGSEMVGMLMARVKGGGGLANPSLAQRPVFRKRRATGVECEPPRFMQQALEQGLQHSVCRVQHDNPWLETFLQAEEEHGGGDYLEAIVADAHAKGWK
ncbi:hypothetical protein AB1Y20_008386 [Prymnesium parvum]|uniref:Zinc finger C2HC5-type domain-containing protein n=1 Tax=Prymnesium parvum TaxID=97485 RepID=A0AB34ISY5_PRYPA